MKKGSKTYLGLPLGPPEICNGKKGVNCEIIENDENKAYKWLDMIHRT